MLFTILTNEVPRQQISPLRGTFGKLLKYKTKRPIALRGSDVPDWLYIYIHA
jgi:hypothetical protein